MTTTRIHTTHIGSLPRPHDLLALLREQEERGRVGDRVSFDARVRSAVEAVVRKQLATGLNIVNDGEQGKPDYSTYITRRLTGFEGESDGPPMGADMREFPAFAARRPTAASQKWPTCSGPIAWRDFGAVETDIENLRRAAERTGAADVFMTAVSPGQAAR